MVPVVAENVVLLWLIGIVTLVGTEMAPVNPIETVVAEETALLRDTVQVEVALLPSVEGLHTTPVNCTGALAVNVNACEPPLSVAVICAV
jgi:hypothetical protein